MRSYRLGVWLIVGASFAVAGCSHNKVDSAEGADALPPPAAEAGTDPLPPPNADGETPPPSQESAAVDAMAQDPNAATPPPPAEEMPPPAANDATASAPPSGGAGEYTVKSGDTLMKIAFETYGDLFKWKEILEANRDRITDPNHLASGTVLKLDTPANPVSIERNGTPYMIKQGDTLGTISNDVYGTKTKWKTIWENNRQLIKDPNKIYAGFYLYYQPDGATTAPQQLGAAPGPDNRAPAATN